MSVEPVSFMYATFGVSSTALGIARALPAQPTYAQRLSSCLPLVNTSYQASSTPAVSVQQAQQVVAPPARSLGAMQLATKAISPSQASSILLGARHATAPRPRVTCSSTHLDNSRLQLPGGVWGDGCHVDFEAIADSSVGGGGLPRPYGRFSAARNGDGTAVWERLPLASSAVDERAARSEPSSSSADLPSPQRSDGKGGGRSKRQPPEASERWRRLQSTMAPPRMLDPLASQQHAETAVVSRAGIPLPAATFLTEVAAAMPEIVRVDGGYNSSRHHLQSGLHKPQPGAVPRPWAVPAQQDEGYEAADERMAEQHQHQHQHSDIRQHGIPDRREGAAALESQLADTLMQRRATGAAGDGSYGGAGGSAAYAGAGYSGAATAVPGSAVSLYILSALSDASKPPTTVPVAPTLFTSRRMALPTEQSLPRRHVPALGR